MSYFWHLVEICVVNDANDINDDDDDNDDDVVLPQKSLRMSKTAFVLF